MKKLLLLLPLIALLTACESKKETCAKYQSRQISKPEAIKRLGLREDSNYIEIGNYCDYYKN